MRVELVWREEDGQRLPMALWRPGPGWTMISSGVLGGGLGPREWVLNAQVPGPYSRTDPAAHLTELTGHLGLTGPGVGMLTAAQVTDLVEADDEGVHVAATAGLRVPTWAAAPAGTDDPELAPIRGLPATAWRPGTINIIVSLPVPLSGAAYVNAVMTATEAKSQAVIEAGFAGTGTASDAICVAAPTVLTSAGGTPTGGIPAETVLPPEEFAGPRSPWGARIARAVHAAVLRGATLYRAKLGQYP